MTESDSERDRALSIVELLLGVAFTLLTAEHLARAVRDPDDTRGDLDIDEYAELLLDESDDWPMSAGFAHELCLGVLVEWVWFDLPPEDQAEMLDQLDERKAEMLRSVLARVAATNAGEAES